MAEGPITLAWLAATHKSADRGHHLRGARVLLAGLGSYHAGMGVIFGALFWLTAQRGVTDPVCGMKVDKAKAICMDFAEETCYFCSEHCLHAFEVSPYGLRSEPSGGSETKVADAHVH